MFFVKLKIFKSVLTWSFKIIVESMIKINSRSLPPKYTPHSPKRSCSSVCLAILNVGTTIVECANDPHAQSYNPTDNQNDTPTYSQTHMHTHTLTNTFTHFRLNTVVADTIIHFLQLHWNVGNFPRKKERLAQNVNIFQKNKNRNTKCGNFKPISEISFDFPFRLSQSFP